MNLRTTSGLGPGSDAPRPGETGVSTFTYDLEGRLLSRTDPEGRTWRLRYDPLGRPSEATDPLGRRTHVAYDELGNVVEQVNAAGERVRHAYDARGLRTRTWSEPPSAQVISFFTHSGMGDTHAE